MAALLYCLSFPLWLRIWCGFNCIRFCVYFFTLSTLLFIMSIRTYCLTVVQSVLTLNDGSFLNIVQMVEARLSMSVVRLIWSCLCFSCILSTDSHRTICFVHCSVCNYTRGVRKIFQTQSILDNHAIYLYKISTKRMTDHECTLCINILEIYKSVLFAISIAFRCSHRRYVENG